MHMNANLRLLTGETMLSLYPILVKLVPVSLLTLTQNRLLSTAIVGYFFMSLPLSEYISNIRYHLISSLYLCHIYASYIGFRNLDVGVSLTLFYTYPLINLVFKSFDPEAPPVKYDVIPYFMMCLVGVALISYGQQVTNNGTVSIGLIAIAISAISESLIYTFYKREKSPEKRQMTPFDMLFSLSFFGFVVSLFFGTNLGTFRWDRSNILFIATINIVLGVIGYALRFSTIHEMSVEWYSVMAFTQVIIGYLLGWSIMSDKITMNKVFGSILILYSVNMIRRLGYK